jgi:hypothetical protein
MRALLIVICAAVLQHVTGFSIMRPKSFRLEALMAKKDKKASTYKAPAGTFTIDKVLLRLLQHLHDESCSNQYQTTSITD